MIRTTSIAFLSAIGLVAVACASLSPPPPDPGAVCEALRPDMPVKYHGNSTDAVTIGNIRRANARFEAACGKAGA